MALRLPGRLIPHWPSSAAMGPFRGKERSEERQDGVEEGISAGREAQRGRSSDASVRPAPPTPQAVQP